MTSEAPERIWPQCDTKNHIAELAELGVKPVPEVKSSFVEYIRHDLHLAAVAEAYEDCWDQGKQAGRFAPDVPSDAQAALEARDKKIREEAMREAAERIDRRIKQIQPEMTRRAQRLAAGKKPGFQYAIHRADLDARMSSRDAILALIEGETDE